MRNKGTEEPQERSTISKEVDSSEAVKKDAKQERESNTNHNSRSTEGSEDALMSDNELIEMSSTGKYYR